MDKLSRRPGESDAAYHRRLIFGKLVDGTLADEDYSELAPYVYGKEYSSDVARRMMYGSRKTLELLDAQAETNMTSNEMLGELEAKRMELQKERYKFFDQRGALNKLLRERARQEELNEIITETVLRGGLPQLQYAPPEFSFDSDNDLLVSLNDIHYGAVVDNYWCQYNSDICRERMRRYLDRVIEIGRVHGSENCVVWANGDLISGNIHHSIAVTNKENVIEQIVGVSELIAEFLAQLSQHFTTVRFASVAGNHSRIDVKERALKDERLDDLVEWYLRARLQNFANIRIADCEKIDTTMYVMDVRGLYYCGVHGDYDGSEAKVRALQAMVRRPIYATLSAHLHHCAIGDVQGIKTMMAGSFIGMDDHCVQRRIYGQAEQLVSVCDKEGVRCSYIIPLGKTQNK